jgi:hypothetical protein
MNKLIDKKKFKKRFLSVSSGFHWYTLPTFQLVLGDCSLKSHNLQFRPFDNFQKS